MAKTSIASIDPRLADSPVAMTEQQAVDRVISSRYFARAPLLASFLVYLCERVRNNGSVRISELEIGVNVFKRGVEFDPREDNIVRTYARRLRQRLQEYYASDGHGDSCHIEIPRGGYVPLFSAQEPKTTGVVETTLPVNAFPEIHGPHPVLSWLSRAGPSRILMFGVLFLLIYSVGLFLVMRQTLHPQQIPERHSNAHSLWVQMFSHERDTYVVPGDAGLVILQEENHRTFSLAEYLRFFSGEGPGDHIAMSYLEDRTLTGMLNMGIVSDLRNLPEAIPDRFVIRAAKNVKFDDLRDGNAILLGSSYSNPWDEVFSDRLNFHFACDPRENRQWIVNRHPGARESPTYESAGVISSHKTYAVLAFLPNLSSTGHVLLVQGLNAAGTRAAVDMLFDRGALRPILIAAAGANGTLRSFELLIEATTLDPDSHAMDGRIVASRIYP